MAGTDELDRWWDGLSGPERADALRSRDTGRLSDAMERSLERAGVIQPETRKDPTVTGDVFEYLKMRH